MRKFTAILFVSLLVTTTEAGAQLLKFPLLLKHFYTHISEGRSTSLAGFIQEHYSAGEHNDADNQQDKQLPFKSVNENSFTLVFIQARGEGSSLLSPFFMNPEVCRLTDFHLQDHLTGVFHPPRMS